MHRHTISSICREASSRCSQNSLYLWENYQEGRNSMPRGTIWVTPFSAPSPSGLSCCGFGRVWQTAKSFISPRKIRCTHPMLVQNHLYPSVLISLIPRDTSAQICFQSKSKMVATSEKLKWAMASIFWETERPHPCPGVLPPLLFTCVFISPCLLFPPPAVPVSNQVTITFAWDFKTAHDSLNVACLFVAQLSRDLQEAGSRPVYKTLSICMSYVHPPVFFKYF